MKRDPIKIGWAQRSITPDRPVWMIGQMYQRFSRYVHDPITATALVLDNGKEQAIFVSMDMEGVPMQAMDLLREALKPWQEICFEKITFNVTHSHNSSNFDTDTLRSYNEGMFDTDILPALHKPEDLLEKEEATKFLVDILCELIVSAWESRAPGGISFAHDYAVVAFNRRPQFGTVENAESIMYGDCSRADFVGMEGGVDPAVELMYTWNTNGEITGVICNVACPSQVYELHCFLTADYWGCARSAIREKLGKNVYVLALCGAAGDLAPVDLIEISKYNHQALKDWGGQTKEVFRDLDMTLLCQNIGERIAEAVARGYRTAKNYIETAPVFCHDTFQMELPIRQVSEDDYKQAMSQIQQIRSSFSKENPMTMDDIVKAFEPQGVVMRWELQNKTTVYRFGCHVLRIGTAAFATNPFELYHAYGLRLKARAKANQVFIVQLSNGGGGYLPTQQAICGGSYSSKPASTMCGPDSGEALIEKTLQTMDAMWK